MNNIQTSGCQYMQVNHFIGRRYPIASTNLTVANDVTDPFCVTGNVFANNEYYHTGRFTDGYAVCANLSEPQPPVQCFEVPVNKPFCVERTEGYFIYSAPGCSLNLGNVVLKIVTDGLILNPDGSDYCTGPSEPSAVCQAAEPRPSFPGPSSPDLTD